MLPTTKGETMKNRQTIRIVATLAVSALFLSLASVANAAHFSAWGPAQKVDEIAGNSSEVNTTSNDGCPIQSPDGLSLYMASNRPRFAGDTRTDLDIWVAQRASTGAPWGAPVNLGEPVNSTADDFCPTPIRGNGLFFVSREALPGACGLGDIYLTRLHPVAGWDEPTHLACAADGGPNTALDEMGPSYVEVDGAALLYFSSGPDIYVSERLADGSFGPAAPVAELNSAAVEMQPNVRKDGLEIVFASNRAVPTAQGGQDVWIATRDGVDEPWSAPVNAGLGVNTLNNETRPSFSWDAMTLYFGRAPGPEGGSDIFISTRVKVRGND
jgi:WD40-like Beta Propeller Repeat